MNIAQQEHILPATRAMAPPRLATVVLRSAPTAFAGGESHLLYAGCLVNRMGRDIGTASARWSEGGVRPPERRAFPRLRRRLDARRRNPGPTTAHGQAHQRRAAVRPAAHRTAPRKMRQLACHLDAITAADPPQSVAPFRHGIADPPGVAGGGNSRNAPRLHGPETRPQGCLDDAPAPSDAMPHAVSPVIAADAHFHPAKISIL